MTRIEWICIAVTLTVALLAAGLLLWQRQKHRQRLKRLMNMLDTAIDGTFTEHVYDETMLSAIENKLDDFLSACVVSARNLQLEKGKIKQLIADISHQTKTPLANVLLYAQLLNERDLPKDSRDCVHALNAQAEKLNFLIGALVKLSRLEAGILTLNPGKNAVQPMLDEIQAQFAPKAAAKEIALCTQITDAEGIFDPKWTAEALSNLVDNAIKYTPAGGAIDIRITSYDLFCRIDIADTGIGIPEGEQARIFTRFYRSPAVSQQEGVGIGLYLARQILTEQGGYIKVDSEPDKGSTFSVFLPRPVL